MTAYFDFPAGHWASRVQNAPGNEDVDIRLKSGAPPHPSLPGIATASPGFGPRPSA